MKKSAIAMIAVAGLSLNLTGCLLPKTRSMGASLMPVPLDHRVDGNDRSSNLTLSADGFWSHNSEEHNLDAVMAGGGNLNLTYRLGGTLSPLFVSAAVGGFGGSLELACTEDDCDEDGKKKYRQWLSSKEGRSDYSFWNIQERVLLGFDFNPGSVMLMGLGAGVQFYQGNSDYDEVREDLDDRGIVESLDESNGFGVVSAAWLGVRLGPQGRYGNVVAEVDVLHKGGLDDWLAGAKLTYSHSTGFFGGVALEDLLGLTLYAGKTFVF